MRRILLTQNRCAIVDNEDFDKANQHKWYYHHTGYAVRNETLPDKKRRTVFLHRIILETPTGQYTDHVNGDKLDCRKINLRLTDYAHNNINKPLEKTNTTGYKGVHFRKDTKKYRAYVGSRKKRLHLGSFNTAEEAALAYNIAAERLYGEFAVLNTVIDKPQLSHS